MDINILILSRINELLAERHWTVNELTERASLSGGVIYEWLGKKKKPSLRAIQAVCNAFGISLSTFFAFMPEDRRVDERNELVRIYADLTPEKQSALLTIAKVIRDLP